MRTVPWNIHHVKQYPGSGRLAHSHPQGQGTGAGAGASQSISPVCRTNSTMSV